MRSSLLETEISIQHCLDLIIAFKRDATKFRYPDWSSLMDYCRYSAAPVGRYLIDLHGGSKTNYPPSDALCSALQISITCKIVEKTSKNEPGLSSVRHHAETQG